MGIAGSPDIIKVKMSMSKLMMSLEYVRTYLDDPLVISSDSFEDYLKKLKVVLTRLNESTFYTNDMKYLGYILTRNGIKPQKKKVQAILSLQLPKRVKQLRAFFRMVQYYQALWARQSKMPGC